MRFQIYGGTNTGLAIVTLTVTSVNDAPVGNSDSANTLEDTSVTINVLANDRDPEGAALTITGISSLNGIPGQTGTVPGGDPADNTVISGMAIVSGTKVIFTPSANFTGTAAFSYIVSDGTNSATATVTVIVAPVNDAPVANSDDFTLSSNTPLTIPAAGVLRNDTDVENDVLTATLVSSVTHGSLSFNSDGSFTYTPTVDYVGGDSFTYYAGDGSATSAVTTVSLTITNTNTVFNFSSGVMTATGFEFKLSGPTVASVVIEASTNMTDWTSISTNSGLSGDVVITDTEAAKFGQRFYRAVSR